MNATQKNDYLSFNNIWHRKKGYEAHIRRLQNVKGSQYYNEKDISLLDQIVNHQVSNYRK